MIHLTLHINYMIELINNYIIEIQLLNKNGMLIDLNNFDVLRMISIDDSVNNNNISIIFVD